MGGQNDRKCLNLEKLFVDELEKHFTVIPEDVYAANPEKSDSEIVAIWKYLLRLKFLSFLPGLVPSVN